MSTGYDQATQTARDYYNSDDADAFYAEIWGGEDIHVGLYESDSEPIRDASRRTVDHLIDRLGEVRKDDVILDIGAGYGGAARRLVEKFGCRVICLNLSEAENERNREHNKEAGVSDLIDVIDGSFEDIPLDDQAVDHVWCQDSILHSGDRERVLREVDRVLKPGGRFVFTDPMRPTTAEDSARAHPRPHPPARPRLPRVLPRRGQEARLEGSRLRGPDPPAHQSLHPRARDHRGRGRPPHRARSPPPTSSA